MQRLVITTGGTGGHIFPALAVAEEVQRRNPDAEVLFIGGQYGREAEFAAQAGVKFLGLPVRGVLGRGLKGVAALFSMLRALGIAWKELGRFRPEAVVGFGGYAGFAPVMAARLRGIPCAVHEQNSVAGASNTLLSKFCKRVFLSFPDSCGSFAQEKCIFTGNPVRGSIRELSESTRKTPARRVLIVGGSLGAHALNTAVAEELPRLKEAGYSLWHQTGKADFDAMHTAYADAGCTGEDFRVAPFIQDMKAAYAWADLVLCRAGATTVAELAVAGLPSVLIPFPFATHDHQTVNASHLERLGAAVLLPQSELSTRSLFDELETLFANPETITEMGQAAKGFGAPNAAALLVDAIEAMTQA